MDDPLTRGSWASLLPADAANLLAPSKAAWWIAGGWALDLFRGQKTRSHADLDLGVLRRDVPTVLRRFVAIYRAVTIQSGEPTRSENELDEFGRPMSHESSKKFLTAFRGRPHRHHVHLQDRLAD